MRSPSLTQTLRVACYLIRDWTGRTTTARKYYFGHTIVELEVRRNIHSVAIAASVRTRCESCLAQVKPSTNLRGTSDDTWIRPAAKPTVDKSSSSPLLRVKVWRNRSSLRTHFLVIQLAWGLTEDPAEKRSATDCFSLSRSSLQLQRTRVEQQLVQIITTGAEQKRVSTCEFRFNFDKRRRRTVIRCPLIVWRSRWQRHQEEPLRKRDLPTRMHGKGEGSGFKTGVIDLVAGSLGKFRGKVWFFL